MSELPETSPLELQCLQLLSRRGEATVRELLSDVDDAPSYSTARKIVERLEEKGAVTRVRLDGKAWVYRCTVAPAALVRRELRRVLDALFDGAAGPLVAHLVDMDALTLEDVADAEARLKAQRGTRRRRKP